MRTKSVLLFFTCVLATATLLYSQEFRGTIAGQVTDASGASVVSAKVTAIKTDTNTKFETTTGIQGFYTLPFLPPGPYKVTAESPGFKNFEQSGIKVSADDRLTINMQLTVGSEAESVTVTAEAPMLEASTASAGQVVTSREVENLPLNGRTPLALARLSFGISPTNSNVSQIRPFDTGGAVAYAMGGAPSGSNEILLNGVPDMANSSRQMAFSPPIDSVDEVKVHVFESDAAYGNTGGGTINVTTKSGTNQFHGSIYEYNETSALNANSFFANSSGKDKVVTRQNQYGGSIGGPVMLPKLFDGHDKAFFFFAFEGFKDSVPAPSTVTVPTDAYRQGDFSKLLTAGQNYQLYDPSTASLQNSLVVRQPFPDNKIPSSRFDPVSMKLLGYYPDPNIPGSAVTGEGNYFVNGVSTDDFTSFTGRMDVNVSMQNKVFVDVHENTFKQVKSDYFNNDASGQFLYRDNIGGVIDDVHTFTPTLFLNTRLGVSRFVDRRPIKTTGTDMASVLGLPAYMSQNATITAMPRVGVGGFATLASEPFRQNPYTTWQLFSSLTKALSQHTLKFGTDLRMIQSTTIDAGWSAGSFTFDSGSEWTKAGTGKAAPAFGGGMAAFLLGLPSSGSFDINSPFTYGTKYYSFFVQDDWRVKPNLTLNLGLRWEHVTSTTERFNRQITGFDPTATNRVTAQALANYAAIVNPPVSVSQFSPTGGLIYATSSNRTPYNTPSSFNPRFGVSWSPTALKSKTVFRGGFGMFQYVYGVVPGSSLGFSQSTSLVPTNDNYLTPYAHMNDPYPGGAFLQPSGSSLGVNAGLGQNINYIWGDLANQYSLRWNFDIQQEIAKDTMLEVSYVGNHSVHQNNTLNLNALPVQYLSRLNVRDNAAAAAMSASISNPFVGLLPGTNLNGTSTTVSNLVRPYPAFGNTLNLSNVPNGGSYYYMLAARVQKRFSNGLQFILNYTHSKLIESIMLNPSDPAMVHSLSSADYPNRWVVSGGYDLPFGRNRHFMGNANRMADLAVGGWTLNAVYTWQSGGLVSWGDVIYYGGDLNWDSRNLTNAFDTTRFNTNSSQQFDSATHFRTFPKYFNDIRQDGLNNFDLSLIKNFKATEKIGVQFRLEAFNAFNHVLFDKPNISPTSKQFGTITAQSNTPRTFQLALRLRF